MNTTELKEYLGMVVDMEESVYLQEDLIKSLKRSLESSILRLGHPHPPAKPIEPINPRQSTVRSDSGAGLGDILAIIFGAVIILIPMIVGAFVGGVVMLFISQYILNGGGDYLCLIGVIIGAIIGLLNFLENNDAAPWQLAEENRKHKEKREAYNVEVERYQAEMKQYDVAFANDAERVKKELAQLAYLKAYYESNIQQVQAHLEESRRNLDRIYSKNIIFPKYRNLVMVYSIYEYICSGRCTELEGHEGAYNILEMEIRMDRIITQLDRVISKLEEIKQNQFMLYTAIQESNRRMTQILESTSQMADGLQGLNAGLEGLNAGSAELNSRIAELQKTSALTAYCSERSQKELAYMNRMNYLSGRNDGVFWNVPPMR